MRQKDEDSVLSLRLPADEAELLRNEAESKGTTISRAARRALASGLKPVAVHTARLTYSLASQRPDVVLGIATAGAPTKWGSTSSSAVVVQTGFFPQQLSLLT